MDGESNGAHAARGQTQGQLMGGWWSPASTDVMSQLCRVCGEPAAGFHFGAFTCEGCKSFFGRTYNNLGSITECKNQGSCVINKKNRTSCKACRLRKCLMVGMSKSGSRYGRRSNWFKIHCLLQEQQHHHQQEQQQRQHHVPPPASPPQKSPKGSSPGLGSAGAGMPRSMGTEGLYGGGTPLPAMLWAAPRALLPPAPHHAAHLQLPFPPFLPAAAAAAAAAAFNGGVHPPSLFGVPQAGLHSPWARLPPPPPNSSAAMSPRTCAPAKTAPLVPTPLRGPPGGTVRRPSPPRLVLEEDLDEDADQEQPIDLSRTAAPSGRRTSTPPTPPRASPGAQDARDVQDADVAECQDKDEGSDSGVSERDSDRAADGDDAEGADVASSRSSPGVAPSPVDLTARPS